MNAASNGVGAFLLSLLLASGNAIFSVYIGGVSWLPLGLICIWLV
ncbi:MAG TPA: hypothetical protein VJ768_03735 [Anaerolineales bacterium]|nr:hypothetical protein [Anaerolineales bacterium]